MKFYHKIKYNKDLEIKSLFASYHIIHVIGSERVEDSFWKNEAQRIGELIPMDEDIETGNKNGNFWIDIKYDTKHPNLYLHSNTRQPLHTDGSYEAYPPELSFFFCKVKAKFGGATTFLDLQILEQCMEMECPSLLRRIKSESFLFSKGNDFKKTKILDDGICNWNFYRVEKSSVTQAFRDFLENRIHDMGLVKRVLLEPGDAVFFRDNAVLHGRDAFIGERWLKKGGINIR